MKRLFTFILVVAFGTTLAQTTAKRSLRPSDIYRLQTISDPRVSPDGKWVSYTLSSVDSAKDTRNSDVWMASLDGQTSLHPRTKSTGFSVMWSGTTSTCVG